MQEWTTAVIKNTVNIDSLHKLDSFANKTQCQSRCGEDTSKDYLLSFNLEYFSKYFARIIAMIKGHT